MNQKHYVHHGYADIRYEGNIKFSSTSGPFASFADASSFAANTERHSGERVKIDTSETHPENKKREKDAA